MNAEESIHQESALPGLTPEAERALLERQRRFIQFVAGKVGSQAIAEELVQTALLRAVERGTDALDAESVVHWFYRVLRNVLVDHLRRTGAEARAVTREAEAAPTAVEHGLHEQVCACMHDLLPTLKPEYAQLVREIDLGERPVSEVATEVGITANNASVRLHRARKALKVQLERTCGACAAHGCLDCSCAQRKA